MKVKKLIKVNSFLYMGMLLLIIKTFLSYSSIFVISSFVDNVLSILGALFLCVAILQKRYNAKILCIYFGVVVFSLYLCYRVNNLQILITVITILVVRDYDFDKLIRFIFQYELLLFIIHSAIGAFQTFILGYQYYFIYNNQIRYSLGFGHANVLSAVVFNLISMYLWLNYEKMTLKKFSMLFVIEFFMYILTKTRTSLFLTIFELLLVYCIRFKLFSKGINFISSIIIPIITFLFYYFTVNLFHSPIAMFINTLLTGRLTLSAYAYDKVGFTFWGQDVSKLYSGVEWDQTYQLNKFTFDSFYSCAFFNLGLFLLIVISIFVFLLSLRKEKKINVFLICWALYSITEVHGINCYMCFSILLISILISKKKTSVIQIKEAKYEKIEC